MRLISCHDGKLLTLDADAPGACASATGGAAGHGFVTGLSALDALPPGGAFARGAVHELLCDPAHGTPLFLAMLLAKCGTGGPSVSEQEILGDEKHGRAARAMAEAPATGGAVIWCDPRGEFYPPALAAHGIPLDQLFLLHPRAAADQTWAVAECLRCKGVAAVVASVDYRLSRVEARRLQLSAERGGGVGLLLRPAGRAASAEHAAVTRWLVRPVPGERTVQRWSVQLIHGHGGRVGGGVILEHSRETNRVRAVEQLAGRPAETKTSSPRRVGGVSA